MPGKRISELAVLSGASSANNDDVLIFDADAGETKRISRSQLAEGMVPDLPLQYYLGVLNAAPTQRLNGDALQTGDFYLDAATKYTTVFNGSGWDSYASIIAAQAAAEAARDAAQLAQTNAETAETNAETAETNAETAEAGAVAARVAAEAAQAAAELAETNAETARDAAFAGADVYVDTAAGLAGTTLNDQFTVVVGDEIIRYRHDSGPTATPVAYYPTPSRVASVFDALFGRVKSNGADLRGLWYADGPVEYYDDTGAITKWISSDPNAREFVLPSILFSGADPRPIRQDRGIYFGQQAGLTASTQVLPDTENFCIVMTIDLPNDSILTYTTKALMDADTTQPLGTLARVTNDVNTTYSPDIPDELMYVGTGLIDSVLVNGYYFFSSPFNQWLHTCHLFKMTGSGGERVECSIGGLGQLIFFFYDGSGSGDPPSSNYINMYEKTGPQTFCIHMSKGTLTVYLNGEEVASVESIQSNMTGLTDFYINTFGFVASPAYPAGIKGSNMWVKSIAVVDNCDFDTMRDVHDTIADYAQTPKMRLPQEAFGILYSGQSWWEGSTVVNEWVDASGWTGEVQGIGGTTNANYGKSSLVAEPLPGVRSTNANTNNGAIGAFRATVNAFGTLVNPPRRAPSNVNLSHAMMKHVTDYANALPVDWTFGSSGGGGFTIASLSAETSPPYLVQALKPLSLASPATVYELLLQSVVWARDYHRERGQVYSVKAFLWQHGHSDLANASYQSDFFAYYDKLNTAIKRITGQSDDVICISPQINYSSVGVGNRTNYRNGVIDQTFLDIVDNRGTRPVYCLGPVYQITNHIHSYIAGYRWQGEIFGKILKRIMWDGNNWQPLRPKSFTLGANYVDIEYYVPVGPMQFDTNANNIPSTVTFDGVNTYGFGFWSGSPQDVTINISTSTLTANGHGFADGTRVMLQTDGTVPTGLAAATPYYVVNSTTNTFQLEASVGGGAITLSGSQTSTHAVYNINKKITAVAVQSATTIRVTLDTAPVAGDSIDYAGAFSKVGNLVDSDAETAYYNDQDWTVPFVGGEPNYADGLPNDLRNWGCAFSHTLT